MISAGEGRYVVVLRHYQIGKDRLFIITDEKEGHIGAITLIEKNHLQTVCKKGHRDDVVSHGLAKVIYDNLGDDIAVVCGIHIDNATKDEIDILVQNAHKCVIKFLERDYE